MSIISILKSKRLWISIIILIGIFLLRHSPYLITAGILLLGGFYNPKTLRPFKNYRFWIVILLLVIIVPIFTGSQDQSILGISYSSERLSKTLLMALRGMSVFILFQVLTTNLEHQKVQTLFSKMGITRFDTIYTLSKETLPRVKSILGTRYTQFRDNWHHRHSPNHLMNFMIYLFSDFIHLADHLDETSQDKKKVKPEDFLKSTVLESKPALIIVTGDPGAGKTPWLESLVQLLLDGGHKVDGLISKKIIQSDEKWHHEILHISTGEKRPLNTMDKINTQIKAGKFYFYPETIEWGCERLISAKSSEWLVQDEVGLLEFEKKGFFPALKQIAADFSGYFVIVIRSNLMEQLEEFLVNNFSPIDSWPRHIIWL